MEESDLSRLAAAVLSGERRALARAITLIESSRPDHRDRADALLEALLPEAGRSVRLGISGAPGVGKSTFIEAFGRHVIEAGHRVAVLAVDPSSKRSGGSILGDKTRMEALARDGAAFIRPSPAGATLGGVARRTREAMLACEAAGFDVVLVETVGVGQSETAVADMVDMFLLMLLPAGGDELQGIKRGIVELADLVLVNKADGELTAQARRTAADYEAAMHLLRPSAPGWTVRVQTCSALTGAGIPEVWEAVGAFREALGASLEERRTRQAKAWMWNEIAEGALDALRRDEGLRTLAETLEREVEAGHAAPAAAARWLLARFLAGS